MTPAHHKNNFPYKPKKCIIKSIVSEDEYFFYAKTDLTGYGWVILKGIPEHMVCELNDKIEKWCSKHSKEIYELL